MTKQAIFQRAKERIDEAKELRRAQDSRIMEDLRFSNPANPEQWRSDDLTLRVGRPSLTLDRTNQFIGQVTNDMRQNNPGITVLPVDDKADPKVAETLGGIIRHIEYRSRASHAYDTAGELAVRCGLGWIRLVPEVVDEATNEQEVRVLRVTDPLSCGLDPNSVEADGADAMWGWAETTMHDRAFKAEYPKAQPIPFGDGWRRDDYITICEYYEITETEENRVIALDAEGVQQVMTEDEYWAAAQSEQPPMQVAGTARSKVRKVRWVKMTGAEVLEETDFPSQYLPIVPVLGYELWVEGERFVCGLTRRLMDGQRLHNFQMSAMAEFLASQPKAPFLVPAEGVAGYEDEWKKLNKGNPAFLPYNSLDEHGNAIQAPSRLAPPPMPGAYAQMAQFAVTEMEASVGMYKSALGQQSNAVSGRAKMADERSSDTSTFHFIDNQGRGIEQAGRVALDMMLRLYDTARVAHIMGLDGQRDIVRINPNQQQAAQVDDKGKVISINLSVGKYDVRVKAGPSYTTQRQETAQQLSDMMTAQPQLAPVLGPMWARLKDMPESDKIAKLLLAMAPPQVQAVEEEGAQDIPPHIAAKMQQMEQQAQQMHQMLDQAAERIKELQSTDRETQLKYLAESARIENDEYKAKTDRLKALQPAGAVTLDQVQAIVAQMLRDMAQAEPGGGEELERVAENPGEPEPPEPQEQNEAPQGAFFTPEEQQGPQ